SPEQARGETQSLTAAADVYGIGAVLYELLTTEKPFSGDSMIEVLKKVVEQPLKAPLGIERDLGVIVMKCLEKAPGARYATAAALADDLEKWLHGEPISARPAGRVERMVKWVRRSPYKAALFALGAVSLISWAALGLLLVPKPPGYEPGGDFIQARAGRPVDVLRLIEIVNPTVLTVWRKEGSAFIGQKSGRHIGLSMPIHSTGDYDLNIDFTLSEIENSGRRLMPLLVLPIGERSAQIMLGSSSGCRCVKCWTKGGEMPLETVPKAEHPIAPVSGLGMLKSQPLLTNGSAIFHHQLTADTPHQLAVQVRLLPKERASLTIMLDGAPFIQWEGPLVDLTDVDPERASKARARQFFFTVWNPEDYTIRYTRMIFTPLSENAWLRTPVLNSDAAEKDAKAGEK
ncbi:MAG: hypothetical protein JNG86_18130, partial [Verrucomicrobiaceae bacterium]|nr:hypothetical protein [Verrucomicrobiaceae bacterium]